MASNNEILPPGTVSTLAAARIVGMNFRTLRRWIERGVLSPDRYRGNAGTKGSAYAWRLPDLVAARTIAELRSAGLSAGDVRKAAATVASWGESFASATLWSDGRDAFRVLPEGRIVSTVKKPGQHQFFPLAIWAGAIEKRFRRELAIREKRERVA